MLWKCNSFQGFILHHITDIVTDSMQGDAAQMETLLNNALKKKKKNEFVVLSLYCSFIRVYIMNIT